MYPVEWIASYVVVRCNELRLSISNLRLQKILYFVQAEFLVVTGYPCFGEQIEAWDFGPVVPEVYQIYKKYGSASIPVTDEDKSFIFDEDAELIDGIIDACSEYTTSQLVGITHDQAPWKNAYHRYCNSPISNESILEFFKEEQ